MIRDDQPAQAPSSSQTAGRQGEGAPPTVIGKPVFSRGGEASRWTQHCNGPSLFHATRRPDLGTRSRARGVLVVPGAPWGVSGGTDSTASAAPAPLTGERVNLWPNISPRLARGNNGPAAMPQPRGTSSHGAWSAPPPTSLARDKGRPQPWEPAATVVKLHGASIATQAWEGEGVRESLSASPVCRVPTIDRRPPCTQ